MNIGVIIVLLIIGGIFTAASIIDGLFRLLILPFKRRDNLEYEKDKKVSIVKTK